MQVRTMKEDNGTQSAVENSTYKGVGSNDDLVKKSTFGDLKFSKIVRPRASDFRSKIWKYEDLTGILLLPARYSILYQSAMPFPFSVRTFCCRASRGTVRYVAPDRTSCGALSLLGT